MSCPQRARAGLAPESESMANHPPRWSHAHYTREELDGLRHAYAAVLANSQAQLIINPKVASLILRAERDTAAVALALSGGYPEMPQKSDGSWTTRKEQLDAAWFHRERALQETLPVALKATEKVLGGRPARERTEKLLKDALHYLKGVDPKLPYPDPTPQDLLTLTIGDANGEPLTMKQKEPAVVGPHGFYWDAITESFWMTHYARDFMDAIIKMLARPKKYERVRLREIQSLYTQAQFWQYDCCAKIAGVVDDPADRFCSILYVFDSMLDGFNSPKPGLPFILLGIMRQLAPLSSDDKDFQDAIISHSEWWTHMNDCTWGMQAENEPLRKRCGLPPRPEVKP